jgi:hypothetical protein
MDCWKNTSFPNQCEIFNMHITYKQFSFKMISFWCSWFYLILWYLLNGCSDAERVNFSVVADLKDPLITKVRQLESWLLQVLLKLVES